MERPVNKVRVIVAFLAATVAALLALPLLECTGELFGMEGFHCPAPLAPTRLHGSFIGIPAVAVFAAPAFGFCGACSGPSAGRSHSAPPFQARSPAWRLPPRSARVFPLVA